jgi:hypothetical protein
MGKENVGIIVVCVGIVAIIFALMSPGIFPSSNALLNPEQQAKIDKFAPQIKDLQRGDLVKLKNGRIYYIFHANGYSFSFIPYIGAGMNEYQTTMDILALQTEKIIKKGDPDYDSAGLVFFKQETLRQ